MMSHEDKNTIKTILSNIDFYKKNKSPRSNSCMKTNLFLFLQ